MGRGVGSKVGARPAPAATDRPADGVRPVAGPADRLRGANNAVIESKRITEIAEQHGPATITRLTWQLNNLDALPPGSGDTDVRAALQTVVDRLPVYRPRAEDGSELPDEAFDGAVLKPEWAERYPRAAMELSLLDGFRVGPNPEFVLTGPQRRALRTLVSCIGLGRFSFMLEGAPGAGKNELVQAITRNLPWINGTVGRPYVPVDADSETDVKFLLGADALLDNNLVAAAGTVGFAAERGAVTGIDEIANVPRDRQSALHRFYQDGVTLLHTATGHPYLLKRHPGSLLFLTGNNGVATALRSRTLPIHLDEPSSTEEAVMVATMATAMFQRGGGDRRVRPSEVAPVVEFYRALRNAYDTQDNEKWAFDLEAPRLADRPSPRDEATFAGVWLQSGLTAAWPLLDSLYANGEGRRSTRQLFQALKARCFPPAEVGAAATGG